MTSLTEEQKNYFEMLENKINELERENSKYKLQLEEANYENKYMEGSGCPWPPLVLMYEWIVN